MSSHPRLPVHPDAVVGGAAEGQGDPRLVRSYLVTGGRTAGASSADLPLEALVALTQAGHVSSDLQFERGAIAALCREVLSVAEIAAHTHLPLGVARVLIADMRDEALLDIHVPVRPGGRPDAALLEKVLDGLRTV